MVLYSAVSSPLDRSKRFTLSSPGRPVHSDTVLGFSWKHSSHAAIAQRLFTHISITVYSQVLIYTAESTEASWSERKCPNFETVTTGIRTRALSIASPAFYRLSYRAPHLTHCDLPVYLGVTLDRTLSYKAHIENTKKKVGARNNIIRKLRNSKWGATPTTLRSSALALCYSAAEYACPVWERSTHAKKLDGTLNETCRMITRCLKPTNANNLLVLAVIAPSDIRRAVASRTERTRQTTDQRHPLNGHLGVVLRLKSRKCVIKSTESINTTAKAARLDLWRERREPLDANVHLNISADEHLPAGAENPWTTWKALNRLRTQVGGQEWTCWSGDFPTNKKPVTVASGRPCSTYWSAPWWTLSALPQDLTTANGIAIGCARHWGGGGRVRFDEHTTSGGRTRMRTRMMSSNSSQLLYWSLSAARPRRSDHVALV